MSRSLWLLVFLAVVARYRRLLRGFRTTRGILLTLLGTGFFLMIILAPQWAASLDGNPMITGQTVHPFQRFGPAGFLAFTVLSLFSSTKHRGVYFSPAEVDFLFQAPFTRRELLSYRLTTQLIHTLLSVMILSAFLFRFLQGYWQTVVGLFLAFTFINLLQIATSLVAGTLEEHAVARGRRFVGLFLLFILLLVFVGSTAILQGGSEFREGVRDLLGSPQLGWVLFPLKAFAETMAAPQWQGFLAWAAVAVAVDVAGFMLVLRFDYDFTEVSLDTSRKFHRRIQEMKAGGRLISSSRKLRLSLPLLPRMHGVGPIVWRQVQEMVRETPGVFYLFLVLGTGILVPLWMFLNVENQDLLKMSFSLLLLLPFVLSGWFRFDFRGDLNRMELLLTLPVSPTLIALGQILVPAVVLSGIQAAGILILAGLGVEGELSDALLQKGLIFWSPLINFVFVAIENLFFLIFPMRIGPAAPGDFQTLGRLMFLSTLKILVLLGVLLLGGLPALLVYMWSHSVVALVLTGLVLFLLMDWISVYLVGLAFARFDVTRKPGD